MAKKSDDRFRVNVIWLLAFVASIGAVIAIVLSYTGHFTGLSGLFSDLLIFIATVLVSYLITNNNERARFEKEMQRLANFSRRRVDLTTANIEALSNELPEIDDLHEMHRLVAFTLRNLAADSGTSLKEIEEMGYVDSEEIPVNSRNDISIPRRPTNPRVSTEEPLETIESERFNCINCGVSNATDLKSAPGTTKAVECSNCGTDLNLHRLGDGSIKVVGRWSSRSSGVGRASGQVSNFRAPQLNASRVTPRPIDANCPRCGHLISFPGKSLRVIDDRFCEGCHANVLHNQSTGEISLGPQYQTKFLDSMPAALFHCDCGKEFSPSFLTTDEGEKYFVCFSCHSLYRNKASEKEIIQRDCPTDGCNGELKFKVDPENGSGKQICYDCKKRFQYCKKEDQVTTLENLEISKVQRKEWLEGGSICPYCGEPSGQGTIENSLGEKFHMHWNCKKPFQIFD